MNAVRMGEFAWSVMEPAQGNYDFSLFDRAISTLGHHGIKTILGTPTATPPKWLTRMSIRRYCTSFPMARRRTTRRGGSY